MPHQHVIHAAIEGRGFDCVEIGRILNNAELGRIPALGRADGANGRLTEIVAALAVHDRIKRDPATRDYMDIAITPVVDGADTEEKLDLFNATEAARTSVARTRNTEKRVRNAGLASIDVVVTNSSSRTA